MNDAEKRRQILLKQARSSGRERGVLPAIHPRYKASYQSIYGHAAGDEDRPPSTFGIRCFICLLLFALFAMSDYKNAPILSYQSSDIVKSITTQPKLPGELIP